MRIKESRRTQTEDRVRKIWIDNVKTGLRRMGVTKWKEAYHSE